MTNDKHVKACVFVDKDVDVSSVLKLLDSRGINAEVFSEPDSAVSKHKKQAFDLLIAQDDAATSRGLKLINEFLTINWMTSSILICDLDEASIHERAEGLGILGHVRHFDEMVPLESLLDRFKKLHHIHD
jgi:DNA-binding NtrC family response regulator